MFGYQVTIFLNSSNFILKIILKILIFLNYLNIKKLNLDESNLKLAFQLRNRTNHFIKDVWIELNYDFNICFFFY